jgi:site-specific DNA-methyltransferase (cytosine-N4-specific)
MYLTGVRIIIRQTNENIKQKLEQLTKTQENFWDFRGNGSRDYVHNLYPYPAMMVPQMIRKLLKVLLEEKGDEIETLLDPFCGSGTVLIEGMLEGKNVIGIDINPLSILISKVKTQPLNTNILEIKIDNLNKNIAINQEKNYKKGDLTNFSGIRKWFKEEIIKDLERIKRAIQVEDNILYRRFFWVAFCETVYKVSNSRSSTYKLHIKNEKDIKKFSKNAINEFNKIIKNNYNKMNEFLNELEHKNLLKYNENEELEYIKNINIIYDDIRNAIQSEKIKKNSVDLMITSPPYGDNHTTITYGQYSILPLRWMDEKDILGKPLDNKILATQVEIDNRSLGGKHNKNELKKYAYLYDKSETLENTIEIIKEKDPDKIYKILSFYDDFYESLEEILKPLKENSYQIWVVGNRRVAKEPIYLEKILNEFLSTKNIEQLINLNRTIPHKRIPIKNAPKGQKGNTRKTINKENIIIFSK